MRKVAIAVCLGLLLTNTSANAACTETQTAIMHKLFFKGFSGGDLAVIEEVFHPDIEFLHPGLPPGLEGIKKIVQMNNDALEGWHFTLHDLICDGDKVVARFTGSGVHVGSFMGETPTNNEVQLNGAAIYLIKNRQIIKDWYIPNELAFLTQLGVIAPIAVK